MYSILYFPLGCGKSWLLGNCVSKVKEIKTETTIVVYRFIGTTMQSSDVFSLIKSIFQQLAFVASSKTITKEIEKQKKEDVKRANTNKKEHLQEQSYDKDESHATVNDQILDDPSLMTADDAFEYFKEKESFARFLRHHGLHHDCLKVVIVLDSLDQLPFDDLETSSQPEIRGTFDLWWPSYLPTNVRLITSCIKKDDRKDFIKENLNSVAKSNFIVDLNDKEFQEKILEGGDVGQCFEKIWNSRPVRVDFVAARRKFNNYFKNLLCRLWILCPEDSRNPLFMTLLVDQVMKIRLQNSINDNDPEKLKDENLCNGSQHLETLDNLIEASKLGVRGLIHLIFEKIEQIHTLELTQYTLGLMTLCKDGISESELEEMAPKELTVNVCQFWSIPSLKFPPNVITKLFQDLDLYVVERMSGGILVKTWFHQEFVKAVEERYFNAPQFEVVIEESLISESVDLIPEDLKRIIDGCKHTNTTANIHRTVKISDPGDGYIYSDKTIGQKLSKPPPVLIGSKMSLVFTRENLEHILYKHFVEIDVNNTQIDFSDYRILVFLLDKLKSKTSGGSTNVLFDKSKETFQRYAEYLVETGHEHNNLHKLQELFELAYRFDQFFPVSSSASSSSSPTIDPENKSKSVFIMFADWMIKYGENLQCAPLQVGSVALNDPIFTGSHRKRFDIRPKPQLKSESEFKKMFRGEAPLNAIGDPIRACSWSLLLGNDQKSNFAYCTEDKCFIGNYRASIKISASFDWQLEFIWRCELCSTNDRKCFAVKCGCKKLYWCGQCFSSSQSKKYQCSNCCKPYVKQSGDLVDLCWSNDPEYKNLLVCLNGSYIQERNELRCPLVVIYIDDYGKCVPIYKDCSFFAVKNNDFDRDEKFLSVEWMHKTTNGRPSNYLVITSDKNIHIFQIQNLHNFKSGTMDYGLSRSTYFGNKVNDLKVLKILYGVNTCLKYKFHSDPNIDLDDNSGRAYSNSSTQIRFEIIMISWNKGPATSLSIQSDCFVSPPRTSFQIEEIDKYRGDSCILVSWTKDNKYFAICYDKAVDIWYGKDKSFKRQTRISGHEQPITEICWSPRNEKYILATCSEDKTISTWDTSGVCLSVINGHTDAVTSLAWSPSGSRLFSCGSAQCGKAKIWDVDVAHENFKVS